MTTKASKEHVAALALAALAITVAFAPLATTFRPFAAHCLKSSCDESQACSSAEITLRTRASLAGVCEDPPPLRRRLRRPACSAMRSAMRSFGRQVRPPSPSSNRPFRSPGAKP